VERKSALQNSSFSRHMTFLHSGTDTGPPGKHAIAFSSFDSFSDHFLMINVRVVETLKPRAESP